jgi:c-di-GMP-binding flagellar brake protein YcgR
MMLTSIAKSGWKELAVQVQKKAGHILVSPISFNDLETEAPVFNSRLLALEEDGLLVESPLDRRAHEVFHRGKLVYVMLIHLNHRWEISCILQGTVRHSTPGSITVPAYQLSNPVEEMQIQRRAYFRVDLTGLRLDPVRITPIDSMTHQVLTHESFLAKPVNISGGGIGLSVPSEFLSLMDSCQSFVCDLHMQVEDESLDLSLRAKRSYYSKGRGAWIYIGLCFEYENDHKRDQVVENLVHFATSVQRHQLSRQGRS